MNAIGGSDVLKKLGLSVVAVLYVWGAVSTNFSLTPPVLPSATLTRVIQTLHQRIYVVTAVLVIRQYWNMFIPPDVLRWRVTISGTLADGTTIVLPVPYQAERSFWQRNFIDTREVKFIQNLAANGREQVRANYAQYLCREFLQQRYSLTAVSFDYYSQRVLSPSEFVEGELFYDPAVQHYPLGVFPCH